MRTEQEIRADLSATLALRAQFNKGWHAALEWVLSGSEEPEYKVGDPDPTPDFVEFCDAYASSGDWFAYAGSGDWYVHQCTWEPGHEGSHIAGDGETVLAVWS